MVIKLLLLLLFSIHVDIVIIDKSVTYCRRISRRRGSNHSLLLLQLLLINLLLPLDVQMFLLLPLPLFLSLLLLLLNL